MSNKKKEQQQHLQRLYDTACWYGYGYVTDHSGKVWTQHSLSTEAKRIGVTLEQPTAYRPLN